MARLLFAPISIAAGLLAGFAGKKLFEQAWGLVDDVEPPDSEHRDVHWPRLIVALAIEGAIFRVVKGLVDHQARASFARATGTWPGEGEPEVE
ncbi:MAG: DUF4235 domain-containing protein [Actinomycetota bacterium]